MKVNRTDFNNSLLDYGFKDYQIKAIQERMDKYIYPQIEAIPLGAEVIKKICAHEWNEKKQSYNEIRLLSILVNRQNIIPRKNERIWLGDDKFNVQYEVDDISYYYSEKEFTIDIYVKEV